MSERTITIASRQSALALKQTTIIKEMLESHHPQYQFVIKPISTKGDRVLDVSLNKIGDKGLFTKELENDMLNHTSDLAVHSLKDMPSQLPPQLIIGAISKREDPLDAVVMHAKNHDKTLDTLPEGSVIGTSSLRRVAQLKRVYPHLKFQSVRGNIQTRIQKLDDYDNFGFDAIILAASGLCRSDLSDRITYRLPPEISLPAVGQGALAVECRENDQFIIELISCVNDPITQLVCTAERATMRQLEGGCQVPIAISSTYKFNNEQSNDDNHWIELTLLGKVLNIDGSKCIESKKIAVLSINDLVGANQLGIELGQALHAMGADQILKEIR